MTRLLDFSRYIEWKNKYIILNYVYDLIGCSLISRAHQPYQLLLQLLGDLKFPISMSKLIAPTHECNCLGVMVNTKNATSFALKDKQKEVLKNCKQIIDKQTITKRQFNQ